MDEAKPIKKPTTVAELKEYLEKHEWVFDTTDASSRPVKSAYVSGPRVHFRGSGLYCTLDPVKFDARGFEVQNWLDQTWMRFEYRDGQEEPTSGG